MVRRPNYRRGIKRGRFADWPENVPSAECVAKQVRYVGSPLHKTYATPAGPPAYRSDKAKCDHFSVQEWPKLVDALQSAIKQKSVGEFRGQFPSRAWVWINDVLHEARQTHPEQGEYHGFPLDDPAFYPLPLSQLEDAPRVQIPTV